MKECVQILLKINNMLERYSGVFDNSLLKDLFELQGFLGINNNKVEEKSEAQKAFDLKWRKDFDHALAFHNKKLA